MKNTKKFLVDWGHNLIGLVGIVVGAGIALLIALDIYNLITVLAVKSQTFVLTSILFGLIVIVSFIATISDRKLDNKEDPQ